MKEKLPCEPRRAAGRREADGPAVRAYRNGGGEPARRSDGDLLGGNPVERDSVGRLEVQPFDRHRRAGGARRGREADDDRRRVHRRSGEHVTDPGIALQPVRDRFDGDRRGEQRRVGVHREALRPAHRRGDSEALERNAVGGEDADRGSGRCAPAAGGPFERVQRSLPGVRAGGVARRQTIRAPPELIAVQARPPSRWGRGAAKRVPSVQPVEPRASGHAAPASGGRPAFSLPVPTVAVEPSSEIATSLPNSFPSSGVGASSTRGPSHPAEPRV